MTNPWNDEHEWPTHALEGWAAETHDARANSSESAYYRYQVIYPAWGWQLQRELRNRNAAKHESSGR